MSQTVNNFGKNVVEYKPINLHHTYAYDYDNIGIQVMSKETTKIKLYTNLFNNNPVLDINENINYIAIYMSYIYLKKVTIHFEKLTEYNEYDNAITLNILLTKCINDTSGNFIPTNEPEYKKFYITDSSDFIDIPFDLEHYTSSGVVGVRPFVFYKAGKTGKYVPVWFEIESSSNLSDNYIIYGISNFSLAYFQDKYDPVSNRFENAKDYKVYKSIDKDYNFKLIRNDIGEDTNIFKLVNELVCTDKTFTGNIVRIIQRCKFGDVNINIPTYDDFLNYFIGLKSTPINK